jgi:hypothetical protein
VGQIQIHKGLTYIAARPGSYIAIAARTLGRCGIGTLILPEMVGEAGLVIM